MKLKSLFCLLIAVVMLFGMLPFQSFATDRVSVNAEIMDVYGGAKGIISMTFDDGYASTAVTLNELMKKYDLKASLMIIADYTSKSRAGYLTPTDARAIFSEGYLEPQSHSMLHTNLKENTFSSGVAEEIYKREFAESKELLETMFPNNDILTFAIPYGAMNDDAMEYAKQHYYAIRTTNSGGVQSLNPGFTDENGSWSKMYSPSTARLKYSIGEYTDDQQFEMIKSDIDKCANGWYIPITHRVGDIDETEMSYAAADRVFAYIASLRDEGKVWVTTYSEAVKYVRERQNSTLQAYSIDGTIYTEITMDYTTEDGLALDGDVFNTPLTVKVEVPMDYGKIFYTTAGQEYSADAFREGDKNYVYVNVVPNDGPVELRLGSKHYFTQWDKYDEQQHMRTCVNCGLIEYGDHVWDEGEVIQEPSHTKTGSKNCKCVCCGDDETFTVKKTEEHTFNKRVELMQFKASDANCQFGDIYYYTCRCGAIGTETFEVGAPVGHKFGEWTVLEEATETTTGIAVRQCDCGQVEHDIIEATGDGAEQGSVSTPVFIGVVAGSAVLSLAIGFAVALAILKKRKA